MYTDLSNVFDEFLILTWKCQSQALNSPNKVIRWRSIDYQGFPPILWHLQLISMEVGVSSAVPRSAGNGRHLVRQLLGKAE